jgi:hypothetical protein
MHLVKCALLAFAVSFFGVSGPARAAEEPRKVDFATVLTDAYDKPFIDCRRTDPTDRTKCAEEVPFTLGMVSILALGAALESDKGESERKKLDRFLLSLRVATSAKEGAPIGLVSDDLGTLKNRIRQTINNAIMVGRAISILEPASLKEK